jgi:hypothetical protein
MDVSDRGCEQPPAYLRACAAAAAARAMLAMVNAVTP